MKRKFRPSSSALARSVPGPDYPVKINPLILEPLLEMPILSGGFGSTRIRVKAAYDPILDVKRDIASLSRRLDKIELENSRLKVLIALQRRVVQLSTGEVGADEPDSFFGNRALRRAVRQQLGQQHPNLHPQAALAQDVADALRGAGGAAVAARAALADQERAELLSKSVAAGKAIP